MQIDFFIQSGIYILILTICAVLVGKYFAWLFAEDSNGLLLRQNIFENIIYKICGINSSLQMTWKVYAKLMMIFNLIGFVVLYLLQRVQDLLPLNPSNLTSVSPDSSFNTAMSFATNTNWQGYSGETTMSYLTQMLGLSVQNFLSAASGLAVLLVLIRGLMREKSENLGNFWVDLTRIIIFFLLPLSILLALLLVYQGVPQTFQAGIKTSLLENVKTAQGIAADSQIIPRGPVASQIAIKQLGTNGGGYYSVNSAHPLENPNAVSNFLEVLSILLIPAGLCFAYGELIADRRQGLALYLSMLTVFMLFLIPCGIFELQGNPSFKSLDLEQVNMEGKEARFGIVNSALWAVATTAASNGSVNSMHDSYTPLASIFPLLLMNLGEVIFGGVGSGLYGMIAFVIVAVFIAGLMVGRTPEYLGKKNSCI